ncbi:LPXTG cell wall anchor domain-containing protein [Arthrobacter zhaoxinii]|uniref:LPXTG cell wall anchor domain-containing protein n=1 Tax=Arthrobacter zhaoxinii TaxID=2964616 RepID=UPI00210507D2|nr:LPXTG cell wall anchor domain-containing protein [Arthrobacter zhaoxinii]MCQ2001770.1 LPXTG cell wall anchor domain-containing protein [Arthrobacter zhaoxinii]
MKKTVSALVLTGVMALAGAGAASALESYPAPAAGTVSDSVVTPGSAVVFSGAGFIPGEQILVTVTYANDPVVVGGTGVSSPIILAQQIGSYNTAADAAGNFAVEVTLGEPGTYTLTATGAESGKVVTSTVVVEAEGAGAGTGANASADGGLPDTGADSAMMLWGAAGVLALGAGVASVAVARRKNA